MVGSRGFGKGQVNVVKDEEKRSFTHAFRKGAFERVAMLGREVVRYGYGHNQGHGPVRPVSVAYLDVAMMMIRWTKQGKRLSLGFSGFRLDCWVLGD